MKKILHLPTTLPWGCAYAITLKELAVSRDRTAEGAALFCVAISVQCPSLGPTSAQNRQLELSWLLDAHAFFREKSASLQAAPQDPKTSIKGVLCEGHVSVSRLLTHKHHLRKESGLPFLNSSVKASIILGPPSPCTLLVPAL